MWGTDVMTVDWHGIFPAATTQFRDDGSLDLDATQRHMDGLIDDGVHGMIAIGTVGENCSLDAGEKRELIAAAKEAVAGRVPLLAGVAECTTRMACDFARDAEATGLDGLMVLPAMVYKSNPRETIAHFRAVARASGLPGMVYNNPVSYGVDITPAMFKELADEPTIVAIKESSENLRRITDIKNATGDRYVTFCGVDDLFMEAYVLGAVGWVAGLVNPFPRETVALYDLMRAGRQDEALALYRWFMPLLHLDCRPTLVQCIKYAQAAVGRGTEAVRPPRLKLDGDERAEVKAIVEKALADRPDLSRLAAAA